MPDPVTLTDAEARRFEELWNRWRVVLDYHAADGTPAPTFPEWLRSLRAPKRVPVVRKVFPGHGGNRRVRVLPGAGAVAIEQWSRSADNLLYEWREVARYSAATFRAAVAALDAADADGMEEAPDA